MSVFLPYLKHAGHLDSVHMTVCNVGSRKCNRQDDYGSLGWQIFAPNLTIYGFDADADACDAANADLEERQVDWTEQHIPLALGDRAGERTLHVTKHPMCSSLYSPNEDFLARFAGLPELVNLDFTIELDVTTLDAFCQEQGIAAIDFLQIDVQGAELLVLTGAEQILSRSVLATQVEVEFSPLYLHQPLFADVDCLLRSKGFTLFDLACARRVRSRSPIWTHRHPGQLLWGDAFYFRDLLQSQGASHEQPPEQLLKLGCIADVLGFADYALEILEFLTLHHGQDRQYNFADVIVQSLARFPQLVHYGLDSLAIVNNLREFLAESSFDAIPEASFPKSPLPSADVVASSPSTIDPVTLFHSGDYMRHNQRRLEHLASLGLDLFNRSVLEVGAGIGDHTSFFLDRGCRVVTTEGRPENWQILRDRYPELSVHLLDMDRPEANFSEQFDVVYCYGLLYHLQHPVEAIEFMARHCAGLLLLETCVSWGTDERLYFCKEAANPTQTLSGEGCRPTRLWVYNQLKQHFQYVYLPVTQPNHEEFPLDWVTEPTQDLLTRAVFVASREQLHNPLLQEKIPMYYQQS